MKIFNITLVVATLALVTAVAAQAPSRIRGQVEKADGPNLVLKLRDGGTLNVKLADDARVSALVPAKLDDLKNDTFIGIAGVPAGNNTIEAHSIHIFMAAQRGVVADRHGPWDSRANSTMTNAYIDGAVTKAANGNSFKVKYKEGEQTIIVTPQTVIAAAAPGNKDEIKAGAQLIIMQSEKAADGSVTAKTLYVGRGVTPAM